MKYVYARVSTRHQDLAGQMRQLEDERCDRIYFEKITGTKSNRPEFQKLLQEIQTGDTLVITKLDRFARSTQDALTKQLKTFDWVRSKVTSKEPFTQNY